MCLCMKLFMRCWLRTGLESGKLAKRKTMKRIISMRNKIVRFGYLCLWWHHQRIQQKYRVQVSLAEVGVFTYKKLPVIVPKKL